MVVVVVLVVVVVVVVVRVVVVVVVVGFVFEAGKKLIENILFKLLFIKIKNAVSVNATCSKAKKEK